MKVANQESEMSEVVDGSSVPRPVSHSFDEVEGWGCDP